MAFGKKKNTPDNQSDTNNQGQSTQMTTPIAKKRNETLASVVHESVIESALDEFSANENFYATYNGEKVYIGLLLKVEDFGGLSKKTNKDPDKGALVEQIKSGRIKALVTRELLSEEAMVIIPDPVTIDAMDEFAILNSVDYGVCYVTQSGEIILTDKKVSLGEIAVIIQNGANAEDVLFGDKNDLERYSGLAEIDADDEDDEDSGYDVNEGESYDTAEDVSGVSDVYANAVGADDISDESEDEPYDEEPVVNDAEEDDAVSEDSGFDNDNFDSDNDMDYDNDYIDTEEEDGEGPFDDDGEYQGDVIDEETVEKTIARKFYSDDLGLEISTEPFDVQFMGFDTFVPFDEDRGEGWLNGYLNQMAKDANAELSRLHKSNLFKARDTFLTLISRFVEDVQRKLDIQDSNTKYGQLSTGLKAQRIEAKKNIDKQVTEKKRELEQEWEATLEQVGADASRMAQQQYRERFGETHRAELFHVEQSITQGIENDYQDAVRIMNKDRRDEAHKLLDYGVNSTLQEVSKMYNGMLEEEQARYQSLKDDMFAFIENNRKDEVARVNALVEEQERANKAEEAMKEATARVKSIEAEFEAKTNAQKSEIESINRSHKQEMESVKTECDNKIAEAHRERDVYQKRAEDMTKQLDAVADAKDREYSSRISELTQEKDAWKDKCSDIEKTSKRSNIITFALLGVAVLAALAVGIIVGLTMKGGDSGSSSQTQQPAVPYVYQQPYAYQAPNGSANGYYNMEPTTSANAYVELPEDNKDEESVPETEPESESKSKTSSKTESGKKSTKSSKSN